MRTAIAEAVAVAGIVTVGHCRAASQLSTIRASAAISAVVVGSAVSCVSSIGNLKGGHDYWKSVALAGSAPLDIPVRDNRPGVPEELMPHL